MEIVQIQVPLESSFLDYPDSESEAVVVYFCGCDFSCSNCQNMVLHDIDSLDTSRLFVSVDMLYAMITESCRRHRTDKVVFLGGDPLAKRNRFFTKEFVSKYRTEFDIAIYTGYDRYEVLKMNIRYFKYLKCGEYDETKKLEANKDDFKMVLASSNQEWCDHKFDVLSKDGVLIFD